MTYDLKTYGEPVLRVKARAVGKVTAAIRRLADDMVQMMEKHGGVGLAAPQVGKSVRLIVFQHPELHPEPMAMANPEIIERSASFIEHNEGCLSVPETTVSVPRPDGVRVKYQDMKGAWIEKEYDGMMARIIFHEVDHLNGKMIVDYMPLDARLKFEAERKKGTKGTAA